MPKYEIIFVCLITWIWFTNGCLFDHIDEESEFSDDMLENIHLRSEIDSAPDWSLSDINEDSNSYSSQDYNGNFKTLLRDWLQELLLDEENHDEDAEDETPRTFESILDSAASEIPENHRKSNLQQNFNFLSYLNMLAELDKRKITENMPSGSFRCAAYPSPTSQFSSTVCRSVNTELGPIEWCRTECKTGYRLKQEFPQYELCGKATRYRWSFSLKGYRNPPEKCERGSPRKQSRPCEKPECFATAAYYMNKIDYSVSPCDNFFDFACGRWNKESRVPLSKSYYITYSVIRDRVDKEVAGLLEQPTKSNESIAVVKAKTFYQSCVNMKRINQLDDEPLLKLLAGNLAWPILQAKWQPTTFNFESTVATLRGKLNNRIIMDVKVGVHEEKHILEISKGEMPLSLASYLDKRLESKLDAYYLLIYDVAVMLGADPNQALWDVGEMRKFELKLAKHKKLGFNIAIPMTVTKLQQRVPKIDWLKMLQQTIQTYPVKSSTPIIVWSESYLMLFENLLKSTDTRVIQNYLVWTAVKPRLKNLSERFLNRLLQYEKSITGVSSLTSRRFKCSREIMFGMKAATSKMFIDKFFKKQRKQAAEEMFNFIRKGFIELLDTEVDWMDGKTKMYAKEKAEAIVPRIGYNPHLYQNATYLKESVKKLVIKEDDYFGNYVRLLEKSAQDYFAKLNIPQGPLQYEFNVRATMVNAFYNTQFNTMVLPGGELQYPFYWGANYPRVLNFGAIGTILGHELTHGFDIVGRMFDLHGKIKNWWSPSSLEQFQKRVECLKEQYSKFYWETAGAFLDGKKTLAENIADNGGIREAYAGYHLWLKSRNLTNEQIEPATGFTNEQMFFVAFANDRCGHFTQNGAVENLEINTHSPGRFRVIGSLQNFDKFSEAFHCPVGSYMNPPKKCVIW